MKLMKTLMIIGLAGSLSACLFGGDDKKEAAVDYSTTEFTWERLTDEGGTYVLNDAAKSYLSANPNIFADEAPVVTRILGGESATLKFYNEDSLQIVEFEIDRSANGGDNHYAYGSASVDSSGLLTINVETSAPDDGIAIRLGETSTYTITGNIVKDSLTSQVHIAISGSPIVSAEDANTIGNELYLRVPQ